MSEIEELKAKIAALEARLAAVEARPHSLPYFHPSWYVPAYPSQPGYPYPQWICGGTSAPRS